jgi:hypothetical protein
VGVGVAAMAAEAATSSLSASSRQARRSDEPVDSIWAVGRGHTVEAHI